MAALKNKAASEQLASLMEENMGLVVSLAKSFNPQTEEEREEFIQLGRIGLWKAIKKHDPSRGTKLSTTAWHYIRYEILRHLEKRKKYQDLQLNLNSQVKDTSSNVNILWEYIPTTLSSREINVLKLRLEGHTFLSIGKQMGFSHEWANSTYKKAIKKIREANA